MTEKIPSYVADILADLEKADYEAYLVGGCVRDLLMDRRPFDWDVATNARPEEIQKVFPDSVYENEFGTVGIKVQKSKFKNQNDKSKLKNDENGDIVEIVEVTPYRQEESYSDKRHPDKVVFTSDIKDDLARRDFTVNAIAMRVTSDPTSPRLRWASKQQATRCSNMSHVTCHMSLIDPYDGQADIKSKTIRAVGQPEKRFSEDALRLMRAVRFSAQLGFEIEPATRSAIKANAGLIKAVSHERVKDELMKLVYSPSPDKGIVLMQELGLLKIVLPELEEGVGVSQNRHHIYEVFEHSVKSLEYAAKYNFNSYVRFASLLHDIGKPRTKGGGGPEATFYGHEYVGAKMAARVLERLKFLKQFIEKVFTLIRYHMFYYNVGEVTDKSVRRLVRKVGPENMAELLQLRQAERKGSGVPKAEPYKLRHLKYMIEKVSKDPLTVGMLKVDGNDVMKTLAIDPGPRVGHILNALLEEVIDNPKLNSREYLLKRTEELNQLGEKDLMELARAGKDKLEEEIEKEDESIKEKFWVK